MHDVAQEVAATQPSVLDAVATSPFKKLSLREFQTALLLCAGKTNHEIGAELGISVRTVDSHRAHVMDKLGTRNNVELVLMAIREGAIPVPTKDA